MSHTVCASMGAKRMCDQSGEGTAVEFTVEFAELFDVVDLLARCRINKVGGSQLGNVTEDSNIIFVNLIYLNFSIQYGCNFNGSRSAQR